MEATCLDKGNVLEMTSFTGGSSVGDALQSIFTALRLYMCSVANRQLSLGVQGSTLYP